MRKLLSLILCLTMVLSMFPFSASAEGVEAEAEEQEEAFLDEEYYAYEEDEALVEYPEEELLEEDILLEEPETVDVREEQSEDVLEELIQPAPETTEELPPESTEPGHAEEEMPDEPEDVSPEEPETPAEEETEEPGEEETEEVPELLPVQVRFLVTPEDAILTVYTINGIGEKEELQAEEDGSWLLLPGEYYYTAEAEGYVPIDETSFAVTEAEPYVEIMAELESSEDEQPMSTASTSGTCGGSLTWTLDNNGLLIISGTGAMYNFTLKNQSSTAPWGTGAKTVVIEQGVTSIGSFAFCGCSNLTSVTIPDSVTSIGNSAFSSCSSLTSVAIPDSVTSMVSYAFYNCSSLTEISLPLVNSNFGYMFGANSYRDNSKYVPASLKTVRIICGDSIPSDYFYRCSSLTSVTIPDSVASIGDHAFSYCSSLTSVTIPDGVTSIGSSTFSDCSSLTSVTIPDGVTSIWDYAFAYCRSLTSVTIPDSVTSIGYCAFYGCSGLADTEGFVIVRNNLYDYCGNAVIVTIPESVTSIEPNAFSDCSSLTSVTIPESVTSIGEYAFSRCSSLTEISMPLVNSSFGYMFGARSYSDNSNYVPVSLKTVRMTSGNSIPSYYFSGCSSLTNVAIPDSVTSIGTDAFSDCNGLISAGPMGSGCNIEFGWTNNIPNSAFSGCRSLTSVTIPDSVTSIGTDAFSGCSSLTEISLPLVNSNFGYMFGASSYRDNSKYVPASLKTVRIICGDSIPSDYFYDCRSLTSVTIPDSVTSVGDYAFYSCYSLTSVTIPDGVTSIGSSTFSDCSSLTSVTIPDGVTSIWDYAFAYCRSLTSVTIPDSVTSIGNSAFSGCSSLTSVAIPDSVTSIGSSAFSYCSSLTEISMPLVNSNFGYMFGARSYSDNSNYVPVSLKTVRMTSGNSIPSNYFSGCSSLTNVAIPDSVTSIGGSAFSGCSSLTSVTIPDGVTSIGGSAFYGCSSLTSVTIPDSVTSIGYCAFYGCSGLADTEGFVIVRNNLYDYCGNAVIVTIPDSVTSIEPNAFSDCSSLTSVTIPESVTSIRSSAFSGCSSLTEIVLPLVNSCFGYMFGAGDYRDNNHYVPASLKTVRITRGDIIPSNYFSGCSNLTSMTIPDSVTSIRWNAFSGCSSLNSVNIYDLAAWCRISFGGDDANPLSYAHTLYLDGTEVKNLIIPSDVTSTGNYAFSGCSSLMSVTIPDGVTSIGYRAFSNCSGLTSVTIPDSVTSIGNYAFSGCSSLTSVTIPDGVTSIGSSTFSDCSSLTSVTIPDGVTSIGDSVFYNCSSLTSVTIGNGVMSIGDSVFYDCSSLTSVTIPDSVTSIGDYAFCNCSSLTSVTIPDGVTSIGDYAFCNCSSLTSVTIPDSVTSIGDYMFSGCSSLTSVTVPDSVTSIGNYAFYNCSSLTSVTIPDSVTSIGYEAFYNCSKMEAQLNLSKLTNIGSGAFYNCRNTAGNIVLLEGISSIPPETFYNCAKLESIAIPKSVTSIGQNAFYGCTGLKTVYYSGTIQRWSTVSVESGNDPILDAAFVADYHIHQIELQGKKDATCTEDGYTGDRVCVLCNEVIEKGTVIPKHHTPQLRNAKTATIYEDGYTGDEICRICGETVSTGKVIPKVEVQQGGTVLTDSGTAVQLNASTVKGSLQWSITEGGAYAEVSSTGLVTPKAVTGETRVTVMAARQDLQDGKVFCVVIVPTDLENLVVPGDIDRIAPGAFAGSENLKTVQIPDTVTAIGDGAFDSCPNLTIYANPGTAGEQFAETHNLPVVEYPDGRFMLETEYLLLEVGQNAQMRFRNGSDEWGKIAVWTSSDPAAVSVDASGSVKALKGGTAFIRATINEGGVEYSAECRIDVLDEAKQGSTEITASLPVTKITAELLRTDYARIPVVLNLKQNAVTAADVELADQTALADSGMMIEEAEFVGGGKADIRDVFGLRIADDRNLELVPIIDVTDSAEVKKVAGSYKSAIILKLSDGTEIQTAEVTVAVKKSQPKLAAKPVVLNSFIQDQTVPVVITGGSVSSVPACDMGFAVLNSNMTVTVKDSAGKSDKATVNITCQPDGWAVKTSLKLTVSNKYTAPKVVLKPAGVTLNRAYSDRVSVPVTVTPLAGMTHTISASGVSGLTAEYDSLKGAVVVGVGTAAAGTYSIPVKADGKTVANLKVKVIDSSAVTLNAKAAGAIDTAVEKSPILITVTGKNINGEAGTYRVKFLQAKGKEAAVEVKDLFTYTQSGNVITVTGKDALKNYVKGYTYTAEVSSSVGTAKPVKLTVKASAKTPAPSITLKASGSIDVLRPGTELVLTPTFKNWFDYDETQFGLRLSNPNLDYRYKDGVFTVFAKEDADVDPALNQAWMTYEGRDVTAKPVKLSLKMGKAVIAQSTKTVTLSKNDRYDRQSVVLSLSDSSLCDIRNARVTMTDPSGNLRLIELGNGEYAIGYKDSRLPGNIAKLKSSTVKLVVFLQGNGGSKANATLSVKVNFA